MSTRESEPAGTPEAVSQVVPTVVGVVLAGGQSRRLGGTDKSLLFLAGRTMIARVLERLAAQVQKVVISSGEGSHRFADVGAPIAPDPIGGFAGPLAGILGGMLWAREHCPQAKYTVTTPVDVPFLPLDLVRRLWAAPGIGADIAIAASGGRLHYTSGLWPIALADELHAWLADSRHRAVHRWVEERGFRPVVFDGEPDPFLNVNTPADVALAESWLARGVA